MKVSVVGQGYVGLPLAVAAAQAGHDVVGIDTNIKLVQLINNGTSPNEDLADDQISQVIKSGRYIISSNYTSVRDSEIVIICVPTPLNFYREPDLSILEGALESIAKELKDGTLVVLESTVSPGTTKLLVANILKLANVNFDLCYSPERIDPANTKWNVINTPKLVSGIDDKSVNRALNFYRSFISMVIPGSSIEVVETAKLLENSFRLINIAFINEIAEFCSKIGIDVREVIEAAASKPYGFMPFYPSAGVGGHCIPIDPLYLAHSARQIGAGTKFIDLASQINQSLPLRFTELARELLGNLKDRKILVVGVAYKPNVSDVRESPAAPLIDMLRKAGAKVFWHDDLVQTWQGENSTGLADIFDLAILVNPHKNTNLSLLGDTPILNTRGGY